MSFEPETTVCPKCKRRGCWTRDVEPAHEQDPAEYPDTILYDWTCKCGHTITEVIPAIHSGFVGGMGKP